MADARIRSNWFSRMIEKEGPDFLDTGKITVEKISSNADRIIDDIVHGFINYDLYGSYIVHPIITNQLIQFCSNKLAELTAEQYALHHIHNEYVNNKLTVLSDLAPATPPADVDSDHIIFGSILTNIEMLIPRIDYNVYKYYTVKQCLEVVDVTKDPYRLYDIANIFSMYEKNNKRKI